MTFTKRVAIIGGGAAGLVQVKALNQEPSKPEIDLYEVRDGLGGTWNYHQHKEKYTSEHQIISGKEYNYSPVYEGLETNVLREAMQFNDFPFLNESGDFPTRVEVLEYLLRFAESIGPYNLHLKTRVESIKKEDGSWTLVSENVVTGETSIKTYDSIVIGNGHYDTPVFPDTPGLSEWQQKYPKSVIHAKFYDKASNYKDKKVLVIGAFSSGSDIAIQLSNFVSEVYVSADTSPVLGLFENPYIKQVGKVDSYDVEAKSAKIGDQVIDDIDDIIVCTGYAYDIPFFKSDINKGSHIRELHEHIFYIEDPSLSFLGLVRDVSPLPCIEAQAAVVARQITGRLKLPPYEEMKQVFTKSEQEKGDRIHRVPFPEEAVYINGLHDWLNSQDALTGYQFPRLEGERYDKRDGNFQVKLKRILARNEQSIKRRLDGESNEASQ